MNEHKNFKHRNPFIVTPMGNFLQAIGDTHLGRVFKSDIRLERRGEYESLQRDRLDQLLNTPKNPELDGSNFARFQAGDWFDKPVVSLESILYSKNILEDYAQETFKNPVPVPLVVISGNHDDAKNISDVTAWGLLANMLNNSTYNRSKFVRFVKDSYVLQFKNGEQILFIGWNISKNACEVLIEAKDQGFNPTTVVCHLDKISYGNEDNVIPYEFFAHHGIKMVISGHEHKPYYFHDHGMEIIGTGSLLPFSHAEDDGENIYMTFNSLDEFKDYASENDVEHKHVRLILDSEDRERILELSDVNSLSLKVVKKGVDLSAIEMSEGEIEQVAIEAYDAKSIWKKAVEETELKPEAADLVWTQIELKGADE